MSLQNTWYDPDIGWIYPNQSLKMVDLVPKDMLSLVNEHWYQFRPINPLWHSLLGIAMIIFGILSVIGNGLVLYLFGSTKYLRTPNNLLIMNLAISDFLMMAHQTPTMAISCFHYVWIFGPLQCELYGLIGSITGFVSIWSNVMITIDRYNVIVLGIGKKPLTLTKAVLLNLLIWLMGIGWTSLPMFGWNRYVPEGNMTTCGLDAVSSDWFSLAYVLCYATFAFYIPLFIFLFCYTYIIKTVFAHERQLREQAKKMNVTSLRVNVENRKQSMEIRLAKIAITTTFLWFMAWTPYMVITFTGVFTKGKSLTPLNTVWGAVFAKFSACYNPIVYGISHPKYRQALFNKFPSLACNTAADVETDNKSTVSEMTTISGETDQH